jgi:glycosyltransferase involved in cell wall biosynthesis
MNKTRVTFIMEQHLGHLAYYQNIRRFMDDHAEIEANWVPVTYTQPNSIWERLPLPRGLRGTLVGRSQAREGLRQKPYDVALFNTQVPAALAGSAVKQRPYVVCTDITPRQYDLMAAAYNHTPDSGGLLSRMKHDWNTQMLQGATRLLPWSTWTGASLQEHYGVDSQRIEVVPPGVDLDVWRPAKPPEAGPLRILFVGGDWKRKGGDLLLEAFRRLPPGQAELVAVTRTPLPPEPGLTAYYHLVPNSPELIQLYHSCHVFVLPTRAEAFGIAAVEASAAGLPVLATAVGGLSDIVVNGETGFTFPVDDVQKLAEHLGCLLDNPSLRKRLGENALERARERFDARKNTARIAQILIEAARSR